VINKRINGKASLSWLNVMQDIKQQLDHLIYPGFIEQTPDEWLKHLPRYLKAIDKRLDKIDRDPAKDKALSAKVSMFWQRYSDEKSNTKDLQQFRWMIEEFRVSLFAQELGTSHPVSEKRLEKAWSAIK